MAFSYSLLSPSLNFICELISQESILLFMLLRNFPEYWKYKKAMRIDP